MAGPAGGHSRAAHRDGADGPSTCVAGAAVTTEELAALVLSRMVDDAVIYGVDFASGDGDFSCMVRSSIVDGRVVVEQIRDFRKHRAPVTIDGEFKREQS